MKPETDERSPLEDYELIMDTLMEILNQYPVYPPPERVPRYLKSFDIIVRAALGVPSEDALPLPFEITPASPDPATAGPQAE